MGYIGRDITVGGISFMKATSLGSTTPTGALTYDVPTSESIMVSLDGVTQVPNFDYNVTLGTVLTFTTSVPNGVVVLVYFLGRSLDINEPADNTVTNAKMANNSVDSAELVAGSVDLAHLSVTGTPSASLALKGDYSWGTAGGTSLAGGMIRTNLLAISSPVTFAGSENGVSYGPISVSALVTVTSPSVWHIL